MTVTFWGVRGSTPCLSDAMQKYGGNTSCVSIRHDDTLLILDAGSGIQNLGRNPLMKQMKKVHILLTHLHMDHIQGLGFFVPFFNPDMHMTMWGPAGNIGLFNRLNRYLSPPLFPVRIRDFNCELDIKHVPRGPFYIEDFEVHARFVNHRGPTLGYRITCGDAVVTFIPDHEPALGVENFPLAPEWTSGSSLAQDADLLIHDAQYSDVEYAERQGWGHSSISHACAFADLTQTRKLALFHHDPLHTDADLEALYDQCANSSSDCAVVIAREGEVLEVS